MRSTHRLSVALVMSLLAAAGCATRPPAPQPTGIGKDLAEPPPMMREYRAAWVTTATNIDWPSKRGLSATDQQAEIDKILDRAEALKLNVLMVQVRSAANRIYPSSVTPREPWARAVSPTGDLDVNPGYNPLHEWVERAHKRGIEVHAWINPFRANAAITNPKPVPIGREGSFNPGEPDVQAHTDAIVTELMAPGSKGTDADVDGVDYDHYFYNDDGDGGNGTTMPAGAAAKTTTYTSPWNAWDKQTWQKHGHWFEKWDDFRRRQITEFIERTQKIIDKSDRPWVKFGISPEGIYREGTIHGGHPDQHERSFASPGEWLRDAKCDFMAPELYWALNHPEWSFRQLLAEWQTKWNKSNRQLVAGMATTKVPWPWEVNVDWSPAQIVAQVKETRTQQVAGAAHFSMRVLCQNRSGVADKLQEIYAEPALVPQVDWKPKSYKPAPPLNLTFVRLTAAQLQAAWPKPPTYTLKPSPTTKPPTLERFYALSKQPSAPNVPGYRVTWDSGDAKLVWLWAVYAQQGDGNWVKQIVPGGKTEALIPDGAAPTTVVAISAINHYGMESDRSKVDTSQLKRRSTAATQRAK